MAGLYDCLGGLFAVISQNAPDKSSPIDKQKYIYSRNLVFKGNLSDLYRVGESPLIPKSIGSEIVHSNARGIAPAAKLLIQMALRYTKTSFEKSS